MQSLRSRIFNAGVGVFPHDDLPIARIGLVQPHGVMAVTSAQSRTVEHVSANVAEILGLDPVEVLGRDVAQMFRDADSRRAIEAAAQPGRMYFDNPIRVSVDGRPFEVVVHAHDGVRFFEIEPFVEPDRDYATLVPEATAKLAAQKSIPGLYRAAAELLQEVSGYDRVMLYKFDTRGHGQVVSERLGKATISFDQLYFPAADIPAEARKILLNGKTRYTPCVTRSGSVMLTLDGARQVVESGDTIDMTHAWLRGVHACHNGYMSHISTKGSMVFPVMIDDHLWGLFVCHNDEEKYLDFESRILIEQMTMMFICKLTELEEADARLDMRREQMERMLQTLGSAEQVVSSLGGVAAARRSPVHTVTLTALAQHLANLAPVIAATEALENSEYRKLSGFEQDLLNFVQADGAAIVRDGQVRLVGATPSALEVLALAQAFGFALPPLSDGGWRVFATNCLPALMPAAAAIVGRACGLLATPLDEAGRDCLMWFRAEEVIDATWAGKPPSEEELRASSMNTPRSSFGRFALTIRGAAKPWTEVQAAMAHEFGEALRAFFERRAAPTLQRHVEAQPAPIASLPPVSHIGQTVAPPMTHHPHVARSGGEGRWGFRTREIIGGSSF